MTINLHLSASESEQLANLLAWASDHLSDEYTTDPDLRALAPVADRALELIGAETAEDSKGGDALPVPKADALPIAEVLVWALDQIDAAVNTFEETDHLEHFAKGIPASQRFIERAAKGGDA